MYLTHSIIIIPVSVYSTVYLNFTCLITHLFLYLYFNIRDRSFILKPYNFIG